jgi:hypothetical protein
MTPIINEFYEKKIFSENSSKTAWIYMIKLDIDHLKMQKYFGEKRT